jgi:hypothetical protein
LALVALSCGLACTKSEIDIILLSFLLFFFFYTSKAFLLFFHLSHWLLPHLARCDEGLQFGGVLDGSGEVLVAGFCDKDIVLDTVSS